MVGGGDGNEGSKSGGARHEAALGEIPGSAKEAFEGREEVLAARLGAVMKDFTQKQVDYLTHAVRWITLSTSKWTI